MLELILKVHSYLILFVLEAFYELAEALIKILYLLTEQLVEFFASLLEQVQVVLSETTSVHDHLGQVSYILFDRVAHLLHRYHMMPVMFVVHASCTDSLRALLTKVFDALVRVTFTRNHLHDSLTILVCHV